MPKDDDKPEEVPSPDKPAEIPQDGLWIDPETAMNITRPWSKATKTLLEAFAKGNHELYDQLIITAGASENSIAEFISQFATQEGNNIDRVEEILTSGANADQETQDKLDEFIKGYQEFSKRSDKMSQALSTALKSSVSELQQKLSDMKTGVGKLTDSANSSLLNMSDLITNLSKQYSEMAIKSKKAIKQATLDTAGVGGKSVEGGLIVEISNISDFSGNVTEVKDQLGKLSEEFDSHGRNADIAKDLTHNAALAASKQLGLLEGQRMTAEVVQDMNGNYIDMVKSAELMEKTHKEIKKHMIEGNSHLVRGVNIHGDLALANQKVMESQQALTGLDLGVDGQLLGMKGVGEELERIDKLGLSVAETTHMKNKLLKEQHKIASDFIGKNADRAKEQEEELLQLSTRRKDLKDKLANMRPGDTGFDEMNEELKTVSDTMTGINGTLGAIRAAAQIKGNVELHMTGQDSIEKSISNVGAMEAGKKTLEENKSNMQKLKEAYARILDPSKINPTTNYLNKLQNDLNGVELPQAMLDWDTTAGGSNEGLVSSIGDLEAMIAENQEEQLKLGDSIAKQQNEQAQINEQNVGHLEGGVKAMEDQLAASEKQKKEAEAIAKLQQQAVTTGTWSDGIIGAVEQTKDKVLDLVGSIPLVGASMAKHMKGPLDEWHAAFGKIVIEGFGEMADEMAELDAKGELTPELKMGIISKGFGEMGKKIKGITSMVRHIFSPAVIGVAALIALLAMAVKRFMDLDAAAEDFRREVGLGKDQTAEIESIARNVNVEFQKFGVSLEKAFASASALTDQFGTLVMSTRENVEMVALLGANLGVTETNAAGALDIFSQLGDGTAESARNSMAFAVGMAQAAGVPLDKVLEDVANASDDTLALLRGSTEELIKAAVEARRLGTTIETLSGSAAHMLDWESSIRSEMEASVFAGRHLSFAKSRQLAFEGDLLGMQKASLATIKEAGEWTEMSYFQQKKLAEAAGMSVGEISKQLTREKQLEALKHGTAEQQAMYNRHLEMQKQLEEGNKKTIEQQGMEMLKQELMQSKMTQLKERFNAMMLELGEKLLPLVEIGFALIVPVVKVLFELAKLIIMPFTVLADIVRALTGDFSGLGERFGSFGSAAYTILGLIVGSVVLLNTKLLGIGPILGKLGSGFANVFSGAASGIGTMTSSLGSFFGFGETASDSFGTKMKTMFGGIKDKIKEMFGVESIAEDAAEKVKESTMDKVAEVGTDSAADRLTSSTDSGAPDDGGGPSLARRMIDGFNEIDMNSVLKAAGALLIISGAIWVAAKAFQEFGTVTWDGVLKGVTALGIMVGSLVVMSKTLTGSMTDLLKASAALALVGAALLPAAYAFDMFADVDWGGFMFGVGALAALVGAAFLLGKIMATGIGAKVLLAGAAAIAVLGLAMIPAAYAMDIMSTAFRNYVDALNTLEWSSIGKILVLSLVFTAVGTLAPFIMMGAYAMMVLSGAIAILAAGVWVLSDGLSVLGPAIVSLGDSAGSLIAFAGAVSLIGYFSPSIIAGAYALGALGLAMIPVAAASILIGAGFSLMANAVSELDSADLVGLVLELGLAFGLLGLMAPIIAIGAKAMWVMTIALIPLAAALVVAGAGMALFGLGLQMTMDSLKDAPEAALGLIAFVGAVSMIALLAPLVIVGAVALGILGIGLAILAVPLLVVSAAMWVLGGAMKLMGDAIETMADADAIGIIFGLGAAFIFLAVTFPLILIGALSMWFMTAALLPLSVALYTAGLGMKMLTDGIQNLKPALESLSGSGPALKEFLETVAQIALFAPAFLFAGIALTIFAVGATFAGYAMMLLALGLELVAPPLESISESLVPVIDGFARLAEVGGGMILAAIGVGMLAIALGGLGLAMVAFSALSWLADGDEIIEQFIRLGHVGPELETASKALKIFGEATSSIGDVGGSLEDIADGMEDVFEVVDDAPSGISKKMEEIGNGMKGLLSAFGPEFLAFSVVADLEDPLESLGDGIEEMFDSLEDVDISIAPNFSIIGEGMRSLLDAFSGGAMLELNEDIEDILEGLGDGIGEFFEGLEDVDPAIIPTLGMIGPGIAHLLVALGTEGLSEFDTDLEDVFEDLGDGIGEFMNSIEGFDADQIMAMSGMGAAVGQILEGLGGMGEIDFDADDFEDILEGVGSGVESLFEPMRNMDDDLLDAARSVGGVLSGLFSNLGTIGEVGDDWDDVFEGFGEGLEAMFDEINDIDRKDLKMAVLVGDVMADLFSAFDGVNLTEDLGDAVETLGEGIYELFDEIEEVDEEAMEMASSVGRAVRNLFKNLPLEAMNQINADTIGEQLNELGYGIYELFYEMDATDFEDQLELMTKVGIGIQQVVIPLIETDLSAIPKDVGDILNDLGDGIYNLFDEMDDLGGEEETLELMSGMGGFGQLLSGVAAISDTRVDMTALQEVADSMRMIISAVSSIYDEIEDEDDSMSNAASSVSSGPTEGTIEGLVERMKGLGQGVRSMIDGFGDIDLLKELAALDVAGLLSGMINAVSGLTQLVNPESFGREFETEEGATDFFTHLAVRMSLLGKGIRSIIQSFSDLETLSGLDAIDLDGIMSDMKYGIRGMIKLVDVSDWMGDESEEDATERFSHISTRMQSLGEGMQSIIGAFSDIDTLSALGEIDFDGIMSDMKHGIKGMMQLTEWGWYAGDEQEETDYYAQISQRMQSLGEGMQSIIGAFSDVDTLSALGDIELDDVMYDMKYGIKGMMKLVDVSSWWGESESEEDATKRFDEMSKRMKSLGDGVGSIIGAFSDVDTLTALGDIDLDDIMEDMKYGIKSLMRLTEWGWYVGDEQEETDYYAEIAERMKSLGEGVGSIIGAFSDADALSALGDIELDDIMVEMKYGIKSMMNLVDVESWWDDDTQTSVFATKRFDEMSKRMKSLGEGVGSIVHAFSDIGTLSVLGDIDIESISEDMMDGMNEMMDGIQDIDLSALPIIYEVTPAIRAMVGSMEGLGSLANVDVEDVMEEMAEGLDEMMHVIEDFDDATISKFMRLGEAMAMMSTAGMDISPVLNGLKSLASQEFADGLTRATSAIYDFAYALLALNAAAGGDMATPSGEQPDEGSGLGQGPTGAVTGAIPDAESLIEGSTGLDQLGKFSGGGFGTGSPGESGPMVVETVASVSQSGGASDMSNVEAKLTELITLMKSGGIAVNLDGKKVHKGLASSIESSPLV